MSCWIGYLDPSGAFSPNLAPCQDIDKEIKDLKIALNTRLRAAATVAAHSSGLQNFVGLHWDLGPDAIQRQG